MKKIFTLCIILILPFGVFSQTPQKMSYQCVVRDKTGALITNQDIGARMSILRGSVIQIIVFQETYPSNPSTNENGLLTIEIGSGKASIGEFYLIDWSSGPYFLRTEIDPTGGTNYTITGQSQILSVPYALYSEKAGSFAETDPLWSGVSSDYYTKTNLRTQGEAEVLFGNLINTPVTLSGYGITNAMSTSHPANNITADNLTKWSTAFGWGNHAAAGYVPAARTLTVNGTAHDLSANRSWNVGTVTSVTTANGITGGPVTGSGTIGLTGQALALHNLGTTGLITRTGSGTVSTRTINAGTGIAIKNGDGVAGNPEISARTYNTGEYAHGGVIFWVDETRQHGLVCAITDQDYGYWGESGFTYARGNHLYSGKINTALIIAKAAANNDGYNSARVCMEYYNPEGTTYGDWYLPAREELYVMYRNKETINAVAVANGGTVLSTGIYWSSTESSNGYAWGIDFNEGTEETHIKSLGCHIRAVRAF